MMHRTFNPIRALANRWPIRPNFHKKGLFQTFIMCFVALLCLLAVTSYWRVYALPHTQFTFSFHDDQATAASTLRSLVDSPANRLIFTQLQNCDNAFFDTELDVTGTLDFTRHHMYQRQPYVANGYLGSRIPNLGHGFAYDTLSEVSESENDLKNGWPLFNKRYAGAFVAGFFDLQEKTPESNFPWLLKDGYESVITAVPQWTSLRLTTISGRRFVLDPSASPEMWGTISNYNQNMSLADGIVLTRYTWQGLEVQYDVLAHREHVSLGLVDLKVSNPLEKPVEVLVEDVLDFQTSQRAQLNQTGLDKDGVYILYQPLGVNYVFAATYSFLEFLDKNIIGAATKQGEESDRMLQGIRFSIPPGGSIQVTKYVGVVTSDLMPEVYGSFDSVLAEAKRVATSSGSLNSLVTSHRKAWEATLGPALEITFPDDNLLTLAARASVYHLSANTRPSANGVTAALGVAGLSSDLYAGMVFWDTDLWMLNGLLLFVPLHARSLVNYRLHTHQQARDNLKRSLSSKSLKGAAYPWTSGRFGNCTATGPCFDYEYHINVAVAISAWNLYLSGTTDDSFLETVAYPLINDAAEFLASYVDYDETLGKYTTKNLTDPDEYANHVDNAAYTNAGISATLKWAGLVAQHLGKPVSESYVNIMGNVFMPTSPDDNNIVLEYSNMNSSVGIKQADVVMVTYPLENELISAQQALLNMDYYSMKQLRFGPAMTYPIFSIVASALLETGCASQSYLLKAVQPFLRGPFAQFLEQNNDNYDANGGTHPAFPFMTAHGGLLQAIVQGLLGLRFDYTINDGKIQRVLKLDPVQLPMLPNGLLFKGIQYLNHTLSMNISGDSLKLTNYGPIRGQSSSTDQIELVVGSRNARADSFKVKSGETITIPLYRTSSSFPKSLTECGKAIFTNITDGAYGDSTVSVNDGDNTTHWQSQTGDVKILVDFRTPTKLKEGFINWGDRPAKSLKLSATAVDLDRKYKDLRTTSDILSNVDFGSDLHVKFKHNNPKGTLHSQEEVFQSVYSSKVSISEPFSIEDLRKVILQTRHNITSFSFPRTIKTRYILLEFEGTHDSLDDEGAKLYEVNLF